jgi:hypothetical protein
MSNATHNVLLTSTSVIATAYAIAFLVAPEQFGKLFGVSMDATAIWLSRFLGAASLGFAAIAFFARRVKDLEARRALDTGYLIGFAASLAIAMWAQYLQVMNALGWIHAAIYGALAVAYFYFLSAEDQPGAAAAARPM